MSSCWKCGRETPPNVTECERCESGLTGPLADAMHREKFHQFDWRKVKTLADLELVVSHLSPFLHIAESHPAFEVLKKFLK